MADLLSELEKDAARVVKKQRAASKAASEGIEQMLQEVARARQGDFSSQRLAEVGAAASVSAVASAKELTAVVAKLNKTVEKGFPLDTERAWFDRSFEPWALHQVIAEHLVRTGRLDIADRFCAEAGVPQPPDSFRAPHAELETLLAALRARDCEPACRWAEENQQALRRGRACLSELEFRLQALRFSALLHGEGREAALGFARTAFSEVDASDASQMDALKRMMSSLMCHLGAPADEAQAAQAWAGAEQMLTRAFSAARALPAASPLSVAVDAGEIVLPKLMKCRAVLEAQGTAWNSLTQLPVALDLPPRFDFHTLFACPVSREQCSAETNPAMLLPCGLALSRASIQKLTRANGRTFRCPYPTSAQCGSDVSVALCRPLFFS